MIKALRIDRDLESGRDFDTLREFLDLLGFQNESGETGRDDKSATFSAPIGKISFGRNHSPQKENISEAWDFAIEVDDPDSTARIVREKGYTITSDYSEYQTGWRHFIVRVASKLHIAVFGAPDHWMATQRPGILHANGRRFAIVLSRFNSFITERLLNGALDGLLRLGAKAKDVHIIRVPGSFEIPSAARTLAETKKYDAIICLGCLLRGDTAHYDVIANEVTRGIGQSAQETGVPHAFGVLTCDTLEQAIDRAGLKMGNKGFEAALAAVEMANLKETVSRKAVGGHRSVVRKRVVSQKAVSRRTSTVRKGVRSQGSAPRKISPKKKH
jgi:6,7-dimethyl-8-ribityllumazine synthase